MATQFSSNQSAGSPPPAAPAVQGSSPATSPSPQADPKDSAFKRDLAAALKVTEGKDAPPPTKPPKVSKAPKPAESDDEDDGDESDDEDVVTDEAGDSDSADDDSADDDSDPSHPELLALNEARDAILAGDPAAAAEALPWLKPLLEKVDKRAFKALQKDRAKTEAAAKAHAETTKKDKAEIEDGRRLVDRGMAELRPALNAVNAYHSGDKQAGARALELLLRKPLATVMRDFYDHVKTGPAVSNLERENGELKARLDRLEGKTPAGKGGEPDKKSDATKLATFGKAYAKHPLAKLDEDNELRDRAFKVYEDSWDPDLETHSLTRKAAMDEVLKKERKRAERLAGKGSGRKQDGILTPPAGGQKAYKDMTKAERLSYDTQLAISRSKASSNDRRQS